MSSTPPPRSPSNTSDGIGSGRNAKCESSASGSNATPPESSAIARIDPTHGASRRLHRTRDHQPEVRYCAGVMILAEDDPLRILYRSEVPVLEPEKETERFGVVDNVVFPTAIDDLPRILFPRELAASMGAAP